MKRSSRSVTGRIGGTGLFFLVVSLLAAAVLLTGCPTPTNSDSGGSGGNGGDGGSSWEGQYQLGDTGPAGGLIFYIDVADDHPDWTYLESAPSTWSTTAEDSGLAWVSDENDVGASFETAFGIGTGKQNTEDILSRTSGTYPAAAAADDYSVVENGTTYEDWFLPSLYELHEMYKNLHDQGSGDFSTTHNSDDPQTGDPEDDQVMYWSSYYNTSSAWAVNFVLSTRTRQDGLYKWWATGYVSGEETYYVRPARRF